MSPTGSEVLPPKVTFPIFVVEKCRTGGWLRAQGEAADPMKGASPAEVRGGKQQVLPS